MATDKPAMPASATAIGERPRRRSLLDRHKILEKNATLLLIFSFLVVTIGGLVQIVPLFYLDNTIEKVEGMRPYTPLELVGRDIYVREGCYTCHSQMIRPMRDEVERYGHYSLAAESMYDHPFQWGSKRTGPDLARVGGAAVMARAFPAHGLALEADLALLAVLQQVAAPQQRGFARPGRADQRDHIAFRCAQADALEHFQPAVGLVQVIDLDDGGLRGHLCHFLPFRCDIRE